MLTLRQIDDIPTTAVEISAEAEQEVLNAFAAYIAAVLTAENQSEAYDIALEQARQIVIEKFGIAEQRVEAIIPQLLDEAAYRSLRVDDRIYRAAGLTPIPLARSPRLQTIIDQNASITARRYQAMVRGYMDGAASQYEQSLAAARNHIINDGWSYQTAITSSIKELAKFGITENPFRKNEGIESATRRNILTRVNHATGQLQLARFEDMGGQLLEVTAHHGARTGVGISNHARWQGLVYRYNARGGKYPDFLTSTGYGEGEGLCGWNCRHSFFPFFEGLSERAYTSDILNGYNNRYVTYNGERIPLYTATQHQRYIERGIRRWKREKSMLEAARQNAEEAGRKVEEWQARQRNFIAQTGLRRDYFREKVAA